MDNGTFHCTKDGRLWKKRAGDEGIHGDDLLDGEGNGWHCVGQQEPETDMSDEQVESAIAYAFWVAITLAGLCGFAFGLLATKVGVWL
jgi:hypothetical protein